MGQGRVAGKVAVITGAAGGLGGAQARLLASEGAAVLVTDIRDDEGRAVAAEILTSGGTAEYLHLDVTTEADWVAGVRLAVQRFGGIDILVNDAGTTNRHRIEDMSLEEWDRVLDVNLKGPFLGTKHVIPIMRERGGGSIVNISSAAGLVARPNNGGVYSASKGGLRMFTKTTAITYAADGIRCNSVHPGPIDNEFSRSMRSEETGPASDRLRRIPLGRLGTNQDIAFAVLYLASDESSFVTGSELIVDGGSTAF